MAKKHKLVPLLPVLIKLGACTVALERIERLGCKTFAELWERWEYPGDARWLLTVGLFRAGDLGAHTCMERGSFLLDRGVKLSNRWRSVRKMRWLRRTFDRVAVERALYDYAMREGLA